jgi:hypothetical protein
MIHCTGKLKKNWLAGYYNKMRKIKGIELWLIEGFAWA